MQNISETHRAYDCLHFPLLLPWGCNTWCAYMKLCPQDEVDVLDVARPSSEPHGIEIPVYNPYEGQWVYEDDTVIDAAVHNPGKLTVVQYYRYRLYQRGRGSDIETLFLAPKLFQEWCVMRALLPTP